jgi:hypothetical protein
VTESPPDEPDEPDPGDGTDDDNDTPAPVRATRAEQRHFPFGIDP